MWTTACHSGAIVLISDPRVTAIAVHENHEAMIDISRDKKIAIGPSPEIPNNRDYTFMRQDVYRRLVQAQSFLPSGMYFCLYEAYRSLELQEYLFQTYRQNLLRQHPTWDKKRLYLETTRLVSPTVLLDGQLNLPPHVTGAAIDVYLVNEHAQVLDMGIHPKDWMQDLDGSISMTASKKISLEAQNNRKIMAQALIKAGFVNYPTEYWHWSYGDKYWAFSLEQSHAIYGQQHLHL